MAAARHFHHNAAVPGHDEIVAMALAAIYSCLVGDSHTQVAIDQELADMGATPDEVAPTFAVMATAMLVEACGNTAEATALAARWTRRITVRSARAVNARDANDWHLLPLPEGEDRGGHARFQG
jgi:hypothetical protein